MQMSMRKTVLSSKSQCVHTLYLFFNSVKQAAHLSVKTSSRFQRRETFEQWDAMLAVSKESRPTQGPMWKPRPPTLSGIADGD